MSRCKSCDTIIDLSEFRYKQRENNKHDDLCFKCRNLSFDTSSFHDYVLGCETESLIDSLKRDGAFKTEELPSFNDKDYL